MTVNTSNLRSLLLSSPRFVSWGIRIDTAPAWLWPLLLAAALWPTWLWMGERMLDGSDDPLGLLAIIALAWLVAQHHRQLRAAPQLAWFSLGLLAVLLAAAVQGNWPPLLVALIALPGLALGLAAFLPAAVPIAPVLGLSVLALPLLASLQFYAGYPLRIVTAEASRWLLMTSHDVQRSGTSLLVDGHLVIVDAPCSGVQMAWFGYFTACVVSLYAARIGQGSRRFFTRLPAVSICVLAGNIARNTVLVALEASGTHLPGWAHEAVGLVALAAVCAAIAWVMTREFNKTTRA
jgi:exosortase/archaeosortase family protein